VGLKFLGGRIHRESQKKTLQIMKRIKRTTIEGIRITDLGRGGKDCKIKKKSALKEKKKKIRLADGGLKIRDRGTERGCGMNHEKNTKRGLMLFPHRNQGWSRRGKAILRDRPLMGKFLSGDYLKSGNHNKEYFS